MKQIWLFPDHPTVARITLFQKIRFSLGFIGTANRQDIIHSFLFKKQINNSLT